jgi:hypothetical protein
VQAIHAHVGGLLDEVHVAANGVALAHGTAHALAHGYFKIFGQPVFDISSILSSMESGSL